MLGIFEAFIFLCLLGYLFNKARANDMVEVMKSHVQDAISVIRLPGLPSTNSTNNHSESLTASGIRNISNERQRQRKSEKSKEKEAIEESLYNMKNAPSPKLSLASKLVTGKACRNCAKSNYGLLSDSEQTHRDVVDILRVNTNSEENLSIFDWQSWFPYLAQVLRVRRYPFVQVSDAVLKDERLRQAIETSVDKIIEERREEFCKLNGVENEDEFDEDKHYQEVNEEHKKRVRRLIIDMRSKISDTLLRFTSYVLYKLLPCFLSGVVAHPSHIEMLQSVAKKSPDVPLIFLPLHRSHLDYILVSFILLNNNIRSPIVAAGDNLRIPFFGALLRGLGAFFIKRKIDPVAGKKDIVYRALLHTYMQHALAAGHNIEFFIEGGRTRTGKPCMPKSGVLSVIVDALMDETIKDALIVPVSVNYERLVDGNFVYEQLGQKKKPETFRSALSAIWNVLNSKYGQMRIDFSEPYSLKELVENLNRFLPAPETPEEVTKSFRRSASSGSMKRLTHQPSTSSLYGTDIVHEEHRMLVDSIARHVVYDCAGATAVMSTNALSFLLLTRFRDGATVNVLAEALDDLRKSLESVRSVSFTGDSSDIIAYAASLLGSKLVLSEKRNGQLFYKPVTDIPSVIELSYYANSLVAHFALDAIMVSSLQKLYQQHSAFDPNTEFKVSKTDLFQSCSKYCDILRYEFILNKSCQNINDLFEDTFDRLQSQNLVSVPTESLSEQEKWARRQVIEEIDSDGYSNYEGENDIANVTLPPETHDNRLVLFSAVAPYSHTYLSVAHSLHSLVQNCMLESEFIKTCITEITSRVDRFECKYGESISTDTVRNCMKVLEKQSEIEITNANGARLVSLTSQYNSTEGVQKIIRRLESVLTV